MGDGTAMWDEALRLAALRSYGVLDTPPEEDFDGIAALAAQVCGTPIALVSLIEDRRQWFKAAVGLAMRETPIEAAICARTVLRPGLVVVPDTLADPRLASNPLVSGEPFLRFYAGARLDTPDGLPLGALCVLDYAPRTLAPEQGEALTILARQVMKALEWRRAVAERDEALAARRRYEARQALLVRELHHRIRNNLATLQALLGATARASRTTDEFYAAFTGRIASLARTQSLLTDDYLQTDPLRDLQRHELEPLLVAGRERFRLSGPDLHLSADLAVPLGMALHEAATNAARHGALSVPQGRVTVDWTVQVVDGRRYLYLDWRESGGPAVAGPARDGVGQKLQRMLSQQCGGEVALSHAPGGIHLHIATPLIERRLVPEY